MPLTEKDLATRLTDAGVAFELLHAEEETPTVEACAAALGVGVDDIVKSVLFADRDDPGRRVLVLARGTDRVDPLKLAAARPGRWRLARPEEVEAATGYEVGTVLPVGHATRLDVLMDARVAGLGEMVAGGGGHRTSLRIARADVERLTGCGMHDVAGK